jgi:putative ABC transport system substrate-binding protein
MIRRRDLITLLGGAATWPLVARAQQGERMRRIGVLIGGDENDPELKRRVSAFTQALADLGWTVGRNMRMDLRWAGDANQTRASTARLHRRARQLGGVAACGAGGALRRPYS